MKTTGVEEKLFLFNINVLVIFFYYHSEWDQHTARLIEDLVSCGQWTGILEQSFFLFICPSCILPCAWKHDTVYAITLLSQKNITFLLFFLCFKEHHVLYL